MAARTAEIDIARAGRAADRGPVAAQEALVLQIDRGDQIDRVNRADIGKVRRRLPGVDAIADQGPHGRHGGVGGAEVGLREQVARAAGAVVAVDGVGRAAAHIGPQLDEVALVQRHELRAAAIRGGRGVEVGDQRDHVAVREVQGLVGGDRRCVVVVGINGCGVGHGRAVTTGQAHAVAGVQAHRATGAGEVGPRAQAQVGGAGAAAIGVLDEGLDLVVDEVVGQADTDGHRQRARAEGCRHGHRTGVAVDAGIVLGVEADAVGRHAAVVLVALDGGLHQHGDAVLRTGAGTGQRRASQAAGQGHRTSEDRGVDVLRRARVETERTTGLDVRVQAEGLHATGGLQQVDLLPLRAVAEHLLREPGPLGPGFVGGAVGIVRAHNDVVADVLENCAGIRAGSDLDGVALDDLGRVRGGGVGGGVGLVGLEADVVAGDGHTDGRTHPGIPADGQRKRGADHAGVDLGTVDGIDIDLADAADDAVVDKGARAAQDDVVGVGTGATDGHAHLPEAGGDAGGEGHGVDLGQFGGRDGDAAAACRHAIGVLDVGLDVAGDGVARQRDADRNRNAGDTAEGHRQRHRTGQRGDAGVVVCQQREAAAGNARRRAEDEGLDVDADLVLGVHARAGHGHAGGPAHGNGCRASDDDAVDALARVGRERDGARRLHAAVTEVGTHLGRCLAAGTGPPADEVLRHGDADGRTDAHAAAADGDGRGDNGGVHGGTALGVELHVADTAGRGAQLAVLGVGVDLGQHHVLRHCAGAADGHAGRAAETGGDRRRHRHRVDGVAADADVVAVAHQHIGLAVGSDDRPALAGFDDGDLQRLDELPLAGVAVILCRQVGVVGIGADVAVSAPDDAAAAEAGLDLDAGAFAQVPQARQCLRREASRSLRDRGHGVAAAVELEPDPFVVDTFDAVDGVVTQAHHLTAVYLEQQLVAVAQAVVGVELEHVATDHTGRR